MLGYVTVSNTKKYQPMLSETNSLNYREILASLLDDNFNNFINIGYSRAKTSLKNNNFVIELEVPRFKKEELNIKFEDDFLTISGKHDKTEINDRIFVDINRFDINEAKATHEYGVLTIEIPKNSKNKAKFISIV